MIRLVDRNRRVRVAAVVVLVALGVFAFMEARPALQQPDALAFVDLAIEHPESMNVGERIPITVQGLAGDQVVHLSLDAGYGPRTFTSLSSDGEAQFLVPAAEGPGAGLVLIEAVSGVRRGLSTMEVVPGEAVSPLDVFLGPRTIEVGTGDIAMIVAVPADSFGNPVVTGTDVDYTLTRPGGETSTDAAPTEKLLSYIEVGSRTKTGRNVVSARVGEAQGPERIFDEVAAFAVPFEIAVVDAIPVANGRDLFSISTGELFDQFGNRLPDGTIGHLELSGVTGRRRMSASAIDSRLHFIIEAPSRPGQAIAQVFTSAAESEPLSITFPTAVAQIPIEITEGPEVSRIDVGRVVEPDGAFIPDGTPAEIISDGKLYDVIIESGLVSIVVPTANDVQVTILGETASAQGPTR